MRRYRKSLWTNSLLSVVVSACMGICAILASTALFALFTLYLMDSMEFSGFFSGVSLSLGGGFAGFICGKFRRRRGLTEGLACAALIYVFLSVYGAAAGAGFVSIKKLLLLGLCGGAGGVFGVNSKRPKHLTSD